MVFTQEQKDFLTWEHLNSREIFVNFETNLFYISDGEYLDELHSYFNSHFNDVSSIAHGTIDEMTLNYPGQFFSLDDVDCLNSKTTSSKLIFEDC